MAGWLVLALIISFIAKWLDRNANVVDQKLGSLSVLLPFFRGWLRGIARELG